MSVFDSQYSRGPGCFFWCHGVVTTAGNTTDVSVLPTIECRRGSSPSSFDHSTRGRGDPVTSQRSSTRPPGDMNAVRGDMMALGAAATTTKHRYLRLLVHDCITRYVSAPRY